MRFLYQLGSTWLHFGSKNLPESRLRGVLGRLGRVLERLGLILERLGGVLERFGRVLGRLGAKNSVLRRLGRVLNSIMLRAVQARRSAWPQRTNKYQREERLTAERLPTERLQTSVDHLPLNPDTQLGAFGPGADPTAQQSCDPATAPTAK